jgi:hypothetical protein
MASAGTGFSRSSPHAAGELFKMMTGVKMLHVPYRGEVLALTDLIGGQVQVYFGILNYALIRDADAMQRCSKRTQPTSHNSSLNGRDCRRSEISKNRDMPPRRGWP